MQSVGFAVVLLGCLLPASPPGRLSLTFAEEALPESELPKVLAAHPRLLVRPTAWSGGLSVQELRERAKRQPWAKALQDRRWRDPRSGVQCALYYLISGDESVVPGLVANVLAGKPEWNCGGGLVSICRQYDCIAGSPTLTDDQRRAMRDHIVKLAHESAKAQESWDVRDLWHHRGAGGWAADVLVAGLTLAGEHPEGKTLLAWGAGYFRRNYLPGWQLTGGAWQGGGVAYFGGASALPIALACWESAAEDGIFQTIRRDYGNWLEGRMYYMMHLVLPDKTRVETTGFDYAPHKLIPGPTEFLLIARAYRNPDGYAFLRWRGQDPKSDILLYDEATDAKAPQFPNRLPAARIWGRDGLGYVQMRSKGWEQDATVIEFRCGDYFWSHTFNNNQNSFYIFHKGRLAVQSGLYDAYRGNHWDAYYRLSVSSNTMLVRQPGEFLWSVHGTDVNGSDADGCFPSDGGQRFVHWGGCVCFTLADWQRRKDTQQHFELGDIAAFELAPDEAYAYVCGDATAAYNNPRWAYAPKEANAARTIDRKNTPKLDLFTRSLVFFGGQYLVVFDRVNALDPTYRKAWLLHSIGKPDVSGKMAKADVPGHIEDFDGDTVTITWSDGVAPPPVKNDPGRLIVRTLLPKAHVIRRIGGAGYEFWTNGSNRAPSRDYRRLSDPQDVGNWRVEVLPTVPATFDHFLHLIAIGDTRLTAAPPCDLVETEGHAMVGLSAAGWVVLFGRRGAVDGPVTYRAPGKAEHLLVDLTRGGRYTVTADGKPLTLAASPEGTLRFRTEQAGPVSVVPAP
jgi:hypothetical protein